MKKNNWPYKNSNNEIITNNYTYPKISVITPSYNQGQYIEETILSVINQNYPNIEYIIIDGGSNDNTIEIIKKYESRITYWISEKDRGQTHAINKGLEKATGEIIAYLNSDDCYFPDALKHVADAWKKNSCNDDFIFIGNCFWANSFCDKGGFIDKPQFPNNILEAIKRSGLGPQPSIFWTSKKNKLFFYEKLIFCMDYEFWLRLLINNYKVIKINETLSMFRIHNLSKSTNLSFIQSLESNGIQLIYSTIIKDDKILAFNNQMVNNLYGFNYTYILNNYNNYNSIELFKILFKCKIPFIKKVKLIIKYYLKT